jgi:hypothetical protein
MIENYIDGENGEQLMARKLPKGANFVDCRAVLPFSNIFSPKDCKRTKNLIDEESPG